MKKSIFFVALVAIAMLTSCGDPVQPEQISVNPNPLTVVGNKVNAEITGTFPVKKFAKKGVLVVTPVLKFEGKEVLGEPVTYVGEKAKENGKKVNYKAGGSYTQSASFDFVPDKFQRIIQEMQEADIMFLIQQSNLRNSELKSQQMKDLHAAIKEADANEKKAINNLEVLGYASPDGELDLNTKLAEARQAKSQKYLEKQLKKNKIQKITSCAKWYRRFSY